MPFASAWALNDTLETRQCTSTVVARSTLTWTKEGERRQQQRYESTTDSLLTSKDLVSHCSCHTVAGQDDKVPGIPTPLLKDLQRLSCSETIRH